MEIVSVALVLSNGDLRRKWFTRAERNSSTCDGISGTTWKANGGGFVGGGGGYSNLDESEMWLLLRRSFYYNITGIIYI